MISVLIANLFTFQSIIHSILVHCNSIRTQCFTWLWVWYVWVMSLSVQLWSIKIPSKMWLTTRTSLPTSPTPKSALWFIQLSAPPPHILYAGRHFCIFKYKNRSPTLLRLPAPLSFILTPPISGKPSPGLYLECLRLGRKSPNFQGGQDRCFLKMQAEHTHPTPQPLLWRVDSLLFFRLNSGLFRSLF